jgi:Fe-S-cluster-containing hydrogenase component 2
MGHIARNAALCYGCKVCQLVCSLHQTGSFWPERSSIRVSRNPQTGIVRWSIDQTCDQCGREDLPLCVKYCSYDALKNVTDDTQEENKRE